MQPDFVKERSMVINVHARGFSLSETLRQHIDACLATALRPFGGAVSRVTVRLSDVNAGRGGNDKVCRVMAVLPNRRLIVTEALHADAYTSIEQSFNRMRRAVSHALARDKRHGRVPTRGFRTSEASGLMMSVSPT